MSGFGDAMTAAMKRRMADTQPQNEAEKAAQEEARRKAAEEAQRRLGYGK